MFSAKLNNKKNKKKYRPFDQYSNEIYYSVCSQKGVITGEKKMFFWLQMADMLDQGKRVFFFFGAYDNTMMEVLA